jgi:hypothetical protein
MTAIARRARGVGIAAGLALAALAAMVVTPAGRGAAGAVCADAAYQHHAAVIVSHRSRQPSPLRVCVGFDEDHLSGAELLNRSGIEWRSDAYQGQGTAVCQVDYEPQPPPSGSCLGSGNDPYWSIWTAPYGGRWTYAQRAITALVIHDGDAEGFRYQAPDGAVPPDDVAAVCPPPAPRLSPPAASGGPPAAAGAPGTAASSPRAAPRSGPGQQAPVTGPAQAPSTSTSPTPPVALSADSTAAAGPVGAVVPPGRAAIEPNRVGTAAAAVAGALLVGGIVVQLLLARRRA